MNFALGAHVRLWHTGGSFRHVAWAFGCSKSAAHKAIHQTMNVIFTHLSDQLTFPYGDETAVRHISDAFMSKYGVPGVMGVVDGSHIPIQRTYQGEHDPYYNRKSFMSIVLMAVVDANKRFLWIDAGAPGGFNDSKIYKSGALYKWFERHGAAVVDRGSNFIIGDSAFALDWHLLKAPDDRTRDYEEHIISQKRSICGFINRTCNLASIYVQVYTLYYFSLLTDARVVVEHAFGLLKRRFPVLLVPATGAISLRVDLVWAGVLLHNWIMQQNIDNEEPLDAQFSSQLTTYLQEWQELAEDISESAQDLIFSSRGRPSAMRVARYEEARQVRDAWYNAIIHSEDYKTYLRRRRR